MGVEFLGKIPLDKKISISTQEGDPFVHKFPDIEASKNLMKIIDRIEEKIGWGK
jgi:MinD superfamily P-loop ATPase